MSIADRIEDYANRLPGPVVLILAPFALLASFLGMLAIALVAYWLTAGLYFLVIHYLLGLG